jgi:hypothetical protein
VTGREASVSTRLKIVATRKGVSFQYATLLYMHEGFLRRLSVSSYRDSFILKGGLLLQCLSESSSLEMASGIPHHVANNFPHLFRAVSPPFFLKRFDMTPRTGSRF